MKEYIEREAALESVREKVLICESLPDTIAKDASLFTLASMNDSLKSIPAADVREVARGKWIMTTERFAPERICSSCECRFPVAAGEGVKEILSFCPNCGADMRPEPPKEET